MPKTTSNQISLYLKGKRNALQQAECYYRGIHVERDIAVAEDLYRQAARENIPGAHFRLGLFYHHRPGRDAEAAEAYFNAFAEGGLQAKAALEELAGVPSAAAHFYLGQVFEREGNRPRAHDSYQAATAGGSIIAIFHLAKWYEAETGHILDALQGYQRAWLNGFEPALAPLEAHAKTNAVAALLLAQGYEMQGNRRALQYYQAASELGNDQAAFRMGEICERKELGAKASPGKEIEYYLLAARRGHPTSLHVLQRLADSRLNPELEFQLAEIYSETLKDKMQALAWYKRAADHRHATAYSRVQSIAAEDMNFAYAAGQSYLTGTSGEQNVERAYFLYALAVRKGHPQAKIDLEASAKSGSAEAQYALACHCLHHQKKTLEAVRWALFAAEPRETQVHAAALSYLRTTVFSLDIVMGIASAYAQGERVAVNPARAVEFYLKASELGSGEAAFQAAELSASHPGKALELYFLAASRGHSQALLAVEHLVEVAKDPALDYKTAEFYEKTLKNKMKALHWYKAAAEHHHATAERKLMDLAKADAEFAYHAGLAYELNGRGAITLQKAFSFYSVAMVKGHPYAKDHIESWAVVGNADAQYALAYEHYHQKKQFQEAALWCMRAAERGHTQAIRYLRETKFTAPVLTVMAEAYEKGIGVKVSLERAMEFYQRAGDLGEPSALLKLGLLSEKKQGDLEENISAAYRYYVCAVNSGCLEALDSLERLAETGSTEMKAGLAQLYRSSRIGRPTEALKWEAKIGVAVPGALSYARVAVTTFLRPAGRRSAADLAARINQLSFGVE